MAAPCVKTFLDKTGRILSPIFGDICNGFARRRPSGCMLVVGRGAFFGASLHGLVEAFIERAADARPFCLEVVGSFAMNLFVLMLFRPQAFFKPLNHQTRVKSSVQYS